MKTLTILLLLIALNCKSQIQQDKYYHASAGVVLSSGMYLFGSENINPIAPSLVAITGAAYKETFDSMGGGNFDGKDFAFTAISGIITNIALHYIFKKRKNKRIIKNYNYARSSKSSTFRAN